MTRLSTYFLPTEREPPADAEALSHKLMVRAGVIRQVGSGLWTWLPAGRRPAYPRVHHEGLLHVRPRPRRARPRLPEARRRLRPDDGPLRTRVVPGRGRRRDDGGDRRARVHGPVRRRRE